MALTQLQSTLIFQFIILLGSKNEGGWQILEQDALYRPTLGKKAATKPQKPQTKQGIKTF